MASEKPIKKSLNPAVKWKTTFSEEDVVEAKAFLKELVPRPTFTREQFLEHIHDDVVAALDTGVQVDQVVAAFRQRAIRAKATYFAPQSTA